MCPPNKRVTAPDVSGQGEKCGHSRLEGSVGEQQGRSLEERKYLDCKALYAVLGMWAHIPKGEARTFSRRGLIKYDLLNGELL